MNKHKIVFLVIIISALILGIPSVSAKTKDWQINKNTWNPSNAIISFPTEDVELYSVTLLNPDDACDSDITLELRIFNNGENEQEDISWQILDENDRVLSDGAISSLDSGHEALIYSSFFIDHEQDITVQVDYLDNIMENNEFNNRKTLSIECSGFYNLSKFPIRNPNILIEGKKNEKIF